MQCSAFGLWRIRYSARQWCHLNRLHTVPCLYHLSLMHNVHIGKSPHDLADIVQLTSSRVTRSGLRSLSETDSYTTPRLRTKLKERAFSFSGPASWNSLPAKLRTISDTSVFKNKLKNYPFGWRSISSWLSIRVLCIPDFSVSVFIDFYCSAPMFLR